MKEQMKQEISMIKERDKCEECFWHNSTSWCSSCRLSDDEGHNYFLPNLFYKKSKEVK